MKKSSLGEFGCDARSFARDDKGCCVGRTWRGRAVSRDQVVLGTRCRFWGICYGYIVYGYKELHPLGLALFPQGGGDS